MRSSGRNIIVLFLLVSTALWGTLTLVNVQQLATVIRRAASLGSSSPSSSPSVASHASAEKNFAAEVVKCVAETEACVSDRECRSCARPRLTDYFDSNVVCMHHYPTIRDSKATRCHRAGVAQCCLSGPDPARSRECMANELAARYYECMMGKFGCSMEDVPCYSDLAGAGGNDTGHNASARVAVSTSANSSGRDAGAESSVPADAKTSDADGSGSAAADAIVVRRSLRSSFVSTSTTAA